MKNSGKNRSPSDSYSVSEAAALVGVSTPTLKRTVQDGMLDGFQTPGGHLRISAESIESVKEQRPPRARSGREPSSILQNRRERLEELNIEAQEVRARRELAKLQREEQEEAEEREAQAQARDEEAAQRQAEIELERERLTQEQARERRRIESERFQEQTREETEQRLIAFRQRWCDGAAKAVTSSGPFWLTAAQRKEIVEALEAEIDRRQPADESRMGDIIARSLQALVEAVKTDRDAQERRQRLTAEALWSLPYSATDAEKVKATAAIREALGRIDNFADVCTMRVAAKEAVQPFRQAIERRELDARLVNWVVRQLPTGWTDRDQARIRRECAEILADLPADVSEPEGKEALESTVKEACAEIGKRQAEQDQKARKAQSVTTGLAEINAYMLELLNEDEITSEDYWSSELTRHLESAVRRGLESELTGDESTKQTRKIVRQIVDGELE
ncbi:MAG TPA: excisionase family DNA-binding protein [Terriglobales bacterium]